MRWILRCSPTSGLEIKGVRPSHACVVALSPLRKGDRIIEVNQKKGDAWALAHECIDSPELRMQVQRSEGCILKL